MPELMGEIVHPGALETKSQLEEDLGEMKSQLSKQLARVRELRVKKVEQPGMESLVPARGVLITPKFNFPRISQTRSMVTMMWTFKTSI